MKTIDRYGVCLVSDNEYNNGIVSATENRLFHPSGNHTDRHTIVYDNPGTQDFSRTATGRLLCRTYSPNARRLEVNPEPFNPSVLRAASWGGVIGGGRPTLSLPIIYGYRDSLGTHVYVCDWNRTNTIDI